MSCGEEESEEASEGQPESLEDRELGGGGKDSATGSTSTEDNGESGGEWTATRAKEVKQGLVRMGVGSASALAPFFTEQ